MAEQAIKVMTMEDVWPGMAITAPDDDTPVDAIVDAVAYDPADQDWQRVVNRTGYIDLPTFTLAHYNGEEYTRKIQSVATVWVLVEDTGPAGEWQPMYQDADR